jgi:hypothetical protein
VKQTQTNKCDIGVQWEGAETWLEAIDSEIKDLIKHKSSVDMKTQTSARWQLFDNEVYHTDRGALLKILFSKDTNTELSKV